MLFVDNDVHFLEVLFISSRETIWHHVLQFKYTLPWTMHFHSQVYILKKLCACTTGDINKKVHDNIVHNRKKWKFKQQINYGIFTKKYCRATICHISDLLKLNIERRNASLQEHNKMQKQKFYMCMCYYGLNVCPSKIYIWRL